MDLDESLIVLQSNTMCSSFMDTSIHVFHSFDVLDWEVSIFECLGE